MAKGRVITFTDAQAVSLEQLRLPDERLAETVRRLLKTRIPDYPDKHPYKRPWQKTIKGEQDNGT